MKLNAILAAAADRAIEHQRPDGSMPPGHNGPYHDPETPVRNTAHWLITFLHLADVTDRDRYLTAAHAAVDYLQCDAVRPSGYTFHHRDTPEKNSCNGLIGQAWTIESLAIAADELADPSLAALAEEVFLLHPFHERLGLWSSVEVDGRDLGFDPTFNHQLWFAAAGGLLASRTAVSPEVGDTVTTFLDSIPETMALYDSGLIRHGVSVPSSLDRVHHLLQADPRLVVMGVVSRSGLTDVELLRTLVSQPVVPVRRPPLRAADARRKAIGYHAFNQYAFALLANVYPNHPVWSTEQFRRSYDYLFSDTYARRISDSAYGYPYNPPGFEVPFAIETFEPRPDRSLQQRWLTSQFQRCYDPDAHEMNGNTADPRTHTARLYQATRLPDLEVDLDRSALTM